jgi:hypothetical protein
LAGAFEWQPSSAVQMQQMPQVRRTLEGL